MNDQTKLLNKILIITGIIILIMAAIMVFTMIVALVGPSIFR